MSVYTLVMVVCGLNNFKTRVKMTRYETEQFLQIAEINAMLLFFGVFTQIIISKGKTPDLVFIVQFNFC